METETQCCGGTCGCEPEAFDWQPLPPVSGQLLTLLAEQKPQVAAAQRRLVASLDDPNGVISAFTSFVE